ncbi:hypothetical protein NKG05_17480 [Oerskovia sp. M15]
MVILLGWGVYQLHTRDPLVDLRTTARPACSSRTSPRSSSASPCTPTC